MSQEKYLEREIGIRTRLTVKPAPASWQIYNYIHRGEEFGHRSVNYYPPTKINILEKDLGDRELELRRICQKLKQ